jgi:hypothetical protein
MNMMNAGLYLHPSIIDKSYFTLLFSFSTENKIFDRNPLLVLENEPLFNKIWDTNDICSHPLVRYITNNPLTKNTLKEKIKSLTSCLNIPTGPSARSRNCD